MYFGTLNEISKVFNIFHTVFSYWRIPKFLLKTSNNSLNNPEINYNQLDCIIVRFSGNLHLHEIVSLFFAINDVLLYLCCIHFLAHALKDIFLNNKRRGTTLITNFHLLLHVITYRRLYVINGSCLRRIFSVLLKTFAKTGMKAWCQLFSKNVSTGQ